ncbi:MULTISPECIES: hypothetical protein [Pseudoalteromonas]|uniref:hypothetical protein n=1 Tax=Pseudoalteromonas TaxID=53246 RepID=UPI0015827D25|nr:MULTISPECIES: hypothetical protein [Pseudoalteromonas]MDI4653875.1 hypothetical protein [Pseudoalteromonas shioyasakiensis]NUJ40085.1 hypothetical protein [Pseudoalteromonas sp. 0303]
MKKLLSVSTLTLALTACGGGSSTDKTPDVKVGQNTAPTLSGSLTLSAKALESTNLVVDLKDEQNDSVTTTIIDKPEWLNVTTSSNQVTFSAEPSLFEVANHAFTVEVSDGKASNQYTLTVNVAENRAAWQPIELSNSEVMGNWQSSDGSVELVFATEDAGVIAQNGELSRFDWSNPDVIALNTQAIDCLHECNQQALLEMEVLAKRDDAIRVELFNVSTDKGEVVTLYKSNSEFSSAYYADVEQSSFHSVNYLSAAGGESYFEVPLASFIPTASGNTTSFPHAEFSASLDGKTLKIESDTLVVTQSTKQFSNLGHEVDVAFDLDLVDAEVIAQFDDFLVLKLRHALTYQDESAQNYINESAELAEALQVKTTISALRKLTPIAVPELTVGKSYTGRLNNKNSDTGEGLTFRYLPTFFTITAADTATVTFNTPENTDSFNWHYDLDNNGDTVKVTGNGLDTSLQFFTQPDGKMIMARERNKDERQARLGYEFMEVIDDSTITLDDYKQLFSYLRQGYTSGNQKIYWYINDDGKGSFYYADQYGLENRANFTPSSYWQLEADKSISFAMMSQCPNAVDYASCKDEVLANQEVAYSSLFNFKILAKEGDKYLFDRLFWQSTYAYSERELKESIFQNSYWFGVEK